MAKIEINMDKCKGCCLCVSCCPKGNIELSSSPNEAGVIYACIKDEDDCTGCAICCQMCPDVAIEIEG